MKNSCFKFLFFILLLNGCASVPFGSMIKLASIDDNELLKIQAEQVRTKITINDPATLQTKNVKLVLKFEYSGGKAKEYQFTLNLLAQQKVSDSGGWFAGAMLRHIYEFKIADESFEEFTRYQSEFVEHGKPQRYYWTVYYYLKNRPQKGEALNLDLELKISDIDEYFYLLKGAELDIN